MSQYVPGTVVVLSLGPLLVGGVATDATVLTLTVEDPLGVETVYTVGGGIVRDSVGTYHANIATTTAQAGQWRYRWSSTGVAPGAWEEWFSVSPTVLT